MKDTKIFEQLDEKCQSNVREIYKYARENGYYNRGFKKYMTKKMLEYKEGNENVITDILENKCQTIKENNYKNYIFTFAICLSYLLLNVYCYYDDSSDGKVIFFLDNICFYLLVYVAFLKSFVFIKTKHDKQQNEEQERKKMLERVCAMTLRVIIVGIVVIKFVDIVHIKMFVIDGAVFDMLKYILLGICVFTYIMSLFNYEIVTFLRNIHKNKKKKS